MRPAPDAAPEVLLCRIFYTLTGLPPSAVEVDAFVREAADDKVTRRARAPMQRHTRAARRRSAGRMSARTAGAASHSPVRTGTNWKADGQRKLVVNGILWSAKVEIPDGGAPVASDEADIMKNWDAKAKAAAKPAAEKAAK